MKQSIIVLVISASLLGGTVAAHEGKQGGLPGFKAAVKRHLPR